MFRTFPLLLLLSAGCSEPDSFDVPAGPASDSASPTSTSTQSPGRGARQASDPVIADDPRLIPLLGAWLEQGSDRPLTITRNPDKSVTVDHPYPTDLWDSVVNNVRFESDQLCYDVYHYYDGPDSFATETGDHPYSGKRNEIAIIPGPSPDRLTLHYLGREWELTRKPDGT